MAEGYLTRWLLEPIPTILSGQVLETRGGEYVVLDTEGKIISQGTIKPDFSEEASKVEFEVLDYREIPTVSEKIVGKLWQGNFFCTECSRHMRGLTSVYNVNIGIYSQECACCRNVIVAGATRAADGGPLSVFDVRFCPERAHYVLERIHRTVDDPEAVESLKRAAVSEFLEALVEDKCVQLEVTAQIMQRIWREA